MLPKLSSLQKQQLHRLIARMRDVNDEIDQLLDVALHVQPGTSSLNRQWFISLPHSVASEVMAHWLRRHQIRGFDRKQLQKLVTAAKTLAPGQSADIDKGYVLRIGKGILALVPRDR